MKKTVLLISAFLNLIAFPVFSQKDPDDNIRIDFNDGRIREINDKITISAPGTNLVEDRFHNKASAIQLHGVRSSYLNLGTSALLKPGHLSISLWVKVAGNHYFGKGYESNPIIVTRNSEGEDFCLAYALVYDYKIQKFRGGASNDSLHAVNIYAKEPTVLDKWHHLVVAFDDDDGYLYLDGELQARQTKGFQSKYNMLDSVLVGHTGSEKNQRYLIGCVDDIVIYDRVIDQQEVKELYKEEDPNTFKNNLYLVMKIAGLAGLIGMVILMMVYRNKRQLRKQKEQLELDNKINELELKVVKAQINPHFISNCLAAIQELIYKNEVSKAGQYIAKFSYFLRQVLHSSDKNYITLGEELEIIRLNLELEQLRFKNDFNISIKVDKDIDKNELVPALISQPFIENAIWHGLLPLNNIRPALLKITVSQSRETIVIEIEDNGVGRDLAVVKGNSKGTALVTEKINALNRLSGNLNHKIEIIDLKSEDGVPIGTKVVILVDNNK